MSNRLFVLSGCASSGLDVSARVLTALGAPCGHEEVFHTEAFTSGGTLFWPPKVVGDASWFAAPVLAKLPESTVVLHQVRHPLATVSELYRSKFFEEESEARHFVQDFLPETRLGGPLVRCMRFWLQWNRMIENASDYEDLIYRRHRIEDLDPTATAEMTALLGLCRDRSTTGRVLDELRPSEFAGPPDGLGWDDLPKGRLALDLRAAAERYGYQ